MPKTSGENDNNLLTEARERFERCLSREAKNWERAKEAIRFRSLKQWPDQLKRERENPYKKGGAQPCLVLDKTNQYIRQVVNEERMNLPSIKCRPVDDHADVEVAKIYDGLVRHILDASRAETVFTTAGEHAIEGGFGYWRLLTEYCDDESFDQEVRLKRITNRFTVLLGPHTESDGSDAKYGFIFEDLPRAEFEAKYPGQNPVDFETAPGRAQGWYEDDRVRVCEYFKILETPQTLVLLDTGEVLDKLEYDANLKAATAAQAQGQPVPIPTVLKERKSFRRHVKWYKLTGAKILERNDIVGRYLPIVKVVGNELVNEQGESRLSGMVEAMMDAQRMHNYSASKFVEAVALAPLAPHVAAKGQVENSPEWNDANRVPYSVLTYDPVVTEAGHLLPAPQRSPSGGIPPGWQQLMMNTEHGIEAAGGMYGASIGGPSRERSGVALNEQKSQGSLGNLHYPDNLARSILHTGRILLEWIPRYYDTKRVARILGEDGQVDTIFLNPEQLQAAQDHADDLGRPKGKAYNLNVGKYDVTVTTGPTFHTKRQEAATMLNEVMKTSPPLMQIVGDLYFRSLDVPYAEQIADRLKAMLPPPIQALEQKHGHMPVDPKLVAAQQQLQQQAQQLQQHAQQLAQAQQELEQRNAMIQANEKNLQADAERLRAQQQVLEANKRAALKEIEAAEDKLKLAAAQRDIHELSEQVRMGAGTMIPPDDASKPAGGL
jgi:hypothetical protein